jgi:hypothetical protein
MKTPSNLQLQAASVSRPGVPLAYTITEKSSTCLIFRVHAAPKKLRKAWGINGR